jgi:hypothetical protein
MKVDVSRSKNSRMWFDVLSKQLNEKGDTPEKEG